MFFFRLFFSPHLLFLLRCNLRSDSDLAWHCCSLCGRVEDVFLYLNFTSNEQFVRGTQMEKISSRNRWRKYCGGLVDWATGDVGGVRKRRLCTSQSVSFNCRATYLWVWNDGSVFIYNYYINFMYIRQRSSSSSFSSSASSSFFSFLSSSSSSFFSSSFFFFFFFFWRWFCVTVLC